MDEKQQEVQALIENLLRVASRNKIAVCGFSFAADPPMIINFGNCSDAHELRLYERLTEMCDAKREVGGVNSVKVGDVN